VRLVPLTSLLAPTSEIYVLKVDTEGHELRVLQGVLPFFEQRSIRHAFVDYTGVVALVTILFFIPVAPL
jgi:hypothetical protein